MNIPPPPDTDGIVTKGLGWPSWHMTPIEKFGFDVVVAIIGLAIAAYTMHLLYGVRMFCS